MDLEQRVVRLERCARRFRYFLTGAAGLAIVLILGVCCWLHERPSAGIDHDGRPRPADRAVGTTAPITASDAWAYVAGTTSSTRVRIVSGGDPERNAVTTESARFSDVPDMEIPFDREEDTVVLVFFSSGKMEMQLGATATFHLGYDEPRPITERTRFTLLRGHTLNEDYKEFGADFVWMGRVPGGKKMIKVRWRSPTGLPVTMGVKSGTPRELVLVEFNGPPEEAGGA